MRGSISAFLLTLSFLAAGSLYAEPPAPPYSRPCTAFATPEAYARVSTVYCLRHRSSNLCHREARDYFKKCNFSGNYEQLSQDAQTDFLKMYVLSFVPQSTSVRFEK